MSFFIKLSERIVGLFIPYMPLLVNKKTNYSL